MRFSKFITLDHNHQITSISWQKKKSVSFRFQRHLQGSYDYARIHQFNQPEIYLKFKHKISILEINNKYRNQFEPSISLWLTAVYNYRAAHSKSEIQTTSVNVVCCMCIGNWQSEPIQYIHTVALNILHIHTICDRCDFIVWRQPLYAYTYAVYILTLNASCRFESSWVRIQLSLVLRHFYTAYNRE